MIVCVNRACPISCRPGHFQHRVYGRWLPVARGERWIPYVDLRERIAIAAVVLHVRGGRVVHRLPGRREKCRLHPGPISTHRQGGTHLKCSRRVEDVELQRLVFRYSRR